MHADELAIDVPLVRRLLSRSFPQLASLPLEPLASTGSSNALFRLGDQLLVRLPRQPGGSATIEKEARWGPLIASGVSVALPETVAIGEPGFGYVEHWSVTRWIEGRTPEVPWDDLQLGPSRAMAEDLAHFVSQMRAIPMPAAALDDPALSWYRGGPLAALDADFREAVDACRAIVDLDLDLRRAARVWEAALAAEQGREPKSTWYHGDLLAENMLMRDGRLAAVLDLGGLAIGDPTVDLVVAWEVLDREGRQAFRDILGIDDASWARSKGWALLIAMITFTYYWRTMPARCSARHCMASTVLEQWRS
jgi:aminoglycoside phosphotransferase (APT) family kinase protein